MRSMVMSTLLLFSNLGVAQNSENILPLIPQPAVLRQNAEVFQLTPQTRLIVQESTLRAEAELFNDFLRRRHGFALKIETGKTAVKEAIVLAQMEGMRESYALSITKNQIKITGDNPGVFYGLQTLTQMLPVQKGRRLSIAGVDIQDQPRYSWRGMHLDVCRHFFPVDFIKKYIDYIAMYKMNTFHWHLTDDQGWRIEIKKYPKLAEVSAWRSGSMVGHYNEQRYDSVRYGGFYTQNEIREVVAYAAKRHVTVVPEIELPGHSVAALAAYPELSCTGGPFAVGKAWGVYDDVFCPKEETFKFLEDVLMEVAALFPGKYVHIGGDEVPKTRWKNCSHCQALIKKEGLHDEHELQSYFIRHIEKFLNGKGKQIIGWDEILEGGLAPNAAVMSWRGTEGGIAAAKQKHYTVMTPGSHCYFDHYQGNPTYEPLAIGGYTTLEKVYSYEPTPAELAPDEQQYILGAQGNLWTEYIATPQHVEYMAMPRMAALAEVVWSPKERRDEKKFQQRLFRHFQLLDALGVNYAKSIYEVKAAVKPSPANDGIVFELATAFDQSGIRYTLDGATPTLASAKFDAPIPLAKNAAVKIAYFENGQQKGPAIEQKFHVSKSSGKKITLKDLPHEKYFGDGAFTLVDGIRGDLNRFGKNWLGFSGKNLEAVIDYGRLENISRVTLDVFDGEAYWIHLPKRVEIWVSGDGSSFTSVSQINAAAIKQMGRVIDLPFAEQTARYLKIVVENAGKIPEGKPGAGNDAWLFVDEIIVE